MCASVRGSQLKVWWCTAHSAQGPNAKVDTDDGREVEVPGIADGECWQSIWGEADMSLGLCRVVEMKLVSVDALAIDKVDGEWPLALVDAATAVLVRRQAGPDSSALWRRMVVRWILDALAASQVGESE